MTADPADCYHLTVEIVRAIHREVLGVFGGLDGVRDLALLESAVAAPQATFGGRPLYDDAIDMAAAYLYFLCRNHPFLDGNKRTALAASIVFLRLNGHEPRPDGPDWERLVLDVATGKLAREDTTARLRMLVAAANRGQ